MTVIQVQQTLTKQVIVTIAGRQWSCLLHSSSVDMTSYYAQSSIPAGTGFLMTFGSDQQFSNGGIDPDAFGFNPDAALITSAGQITQIVRSVWTQARPVLLNGVAQYILIVNAGELSGISLGSSMTITEVGAGFDITTLLTSIMPFIMLMMVMRIITPMTKAAVKSKEKKAGKGDI